MCNTIKRRGNCKNSKLCTWEEKEKRLKELEKMNKMDFTSKLEWENFDKRIVLLTKTNGKTLILKEGQYIKFIRTFTYIEDDTVKEEKTETRCEILGFTWGGGGTGEISPPGDILFRPYRDDEKRWATPVFTQRKMNKQDLDSIKLINEEEAKELKEAAEAEKAKKQQQQEEAEKAAKEAAKEAAEEENIKCEDIFDTKDSCQTINTKYRKNARKYHPDKKWGNEEAAEKKFKQLSDCYDTAKVSCKQSGSSKDNEEKTDDEGEKTDDEGEKTDDEGEKTDDEGEKTEEIHHVQTVNQEALDQKLKDLQKNMTKKWKN